MRYMPQVHPYIILLLFPLVRLANALLKPRLPECMSAGAMQSRLDNGEVKQTVILAFGAEDEEQALFGQRQKEQANHATRCST